MHSPCVSPASGRSTLRSTALRRAGTYVPAEGRARSLPAPRTPPHPRGPPAPPHSAPPHSAPPHSAPPPRRLTSRSPTPRGPPGAAHPAPPHPARPTRRRPTHATHSRRPTPAPVHLCRGCERPGPGCSLTAAQRRAVRRGEKRVRENSTGQDRLRPRGWSLAPQLFAIQVALTLVVLAGCGRRVPAGRAPRPEPSAGAGHRARVAETPTVRAALSEDPSAMLQPYAEQMRVTPAPTSSWS